MSAVNLGYVYQFPALTMGQEKYFASNPLMARGGAKNILYVADKATNKWNAYADLPTVRRAGRETEVIIVQKGESETLVEVFNNGTKAQHSYTLHQGTLEDAHVVNDTWLLSIMDGEVSLLDLRNKDATPQKVLPFPIPVGARTCVNLGYLMVWTGECVYIADLFGESLDHGPQKLVQPTRVALASHLDRGDKIIAASHLAMVSLKPDFRISVGMKRRHLITFHNASGAVIFEKEVSGKVEAIQQAFGWGCGVSDEENVYYLSGPQVVTEPHYSIPRDSIVLCDGEIYAYVHRSQSLVQLASAKGQTTNTITGQPNNSRMVAATGTGVINIYRAAHSKKTITSSVVASFPKKLPASPIESFVPFVYSDGGRTYYWGTTDCPVKPSICLSVVSNNENGHIVSHYVSDMFGIVRHMPPIWRKTRGAVIIQWGRILAILDARTGKKLRNTQELPVGSWFLVDAHSATDSAGAVTGAWVVYSKSPQGTDRNLWFVHVSQDRPNLSYDSATVGKNISCTYSDQTGTLYMCDIPSRVCYIVTLSSLLVDSIPNVQVFQSGDRVYLLDDQGSLSLLDQNPNGKWSLAAPILTISQTKMRTLGSGQAPVCAVGVGKKSIIVAGERACLIFDTSNTNNYVKTSYPHSAKSPGLYWPVGNPLDEGERTAVLWTDEGFWHVEDPDNFYTYPRGRFTPNNIAIMGPRILAMSDTLVGKRFLVKEESSAIVEFFV